MSDTGHWQPVADGAGVWAGQYVFRNNPMNTVVVDLGDGKLMAVSPGTGMSDAALDELDALRKLAGGDVHLYESPAKKHEDLVMFVTREGASVLYSNEVLTNSPELPKSLVFKILFKLTKSGPGLTMNNLAMKLIGVDRSD